MLDLRYYYILFASLALFGYNHTLRHESKTSFVRLSFINRTQNFAEIFAMMK